LSWGGGIKTGKARKDSWCFAPTQPNLPVPQGKGTGAEVTKGVLSCKRKRRHIFQTIGKWEKEEEKKDGIKKGSAICEAERPPYSGNLGRNERFEKHCRSKHRIYAGYEGK